MNQTDKKEGRHTSTSRQAENSIFENPVLAGLFAITAAIAWGWAYPLIKIGFREFGISPDMTGSKMLFAGLRFTVSGLILLSLARIQHRHFAVNRGRNWWFILLFALLNTTFHYAFFYFGLSHSDGARAAILNSLGVFAVVILACLIFRSDKMTGRKIAGCAIGFAGILALNMGDAHSGRFTWNGDGFIILNALCSAAASLLTRGLVRRVDVFVGTGYSLSIGGMLLVLPGIYMGGTLPHFSHLGILCLLLLIAISALGFALYNQLIIHNPVGKIAIYNSLIPVVGAVTSCLCLGEAFYWKYLLAGTLATAGIYLINKDKA